MELYRCEIKHNDHDQYDGFVVCARSREEALNARPDQDWPYGETITVTYLGVADKDIKPGFVLMSYNAG